MKFPLPVRPFPTPLKLSERDHASLSSLADGLVDSTVLDFDQLLREHQGVPDAKQWKPVKQRQNMVVYQQRSTSGSSNSFGASVMGGRLRRTRSRVDLTEASQSQVSRSRFFGSGGIGSRNDVERSTAKEPKMPPQMLWHGTIDGDLEDLMYGIVSQNDSMERIKSSYVNDNAVDSAVIASVRSADVDDPFRGLQLKWFVADKSGLIVRHRDFVYLESTGMTTMNPTGTPGGDERVGYHIVHSLDVRGVSSLEDLKIVRGKLEVYQIFRQKANGTVEVFAKVQIDLGGDATHGTSVALAIEKVSSLDFAIECAHRRKLNWMLYRAHVDVINIASIRTTTNIADEYEDVERCSVCTKSLRKPTLFHHFENSKGMLSMGKKKGSKKKTSGCSICSASMCSRCTEEYKLSFLVESKCPSTGKAGKVDIIQVPLECCKRCVHAATQLKATRAAVSELSMADPLAAYRRLELFDKLANSSSIAPPEILDFDFDAAISARETESTVNIYDRDFGSVSSLSSQRSNTSSSSSNRASAVNATHTIGGRFA